MTVIGPISDTYGQLPDEALAAMADADHNINIHAGDIGVSRFCSVQARGVGRRPRRCWATTTDESTGFRVSRFLASGDRRLLVAHYPRARRSGSTAARVRRRAIPSRRSTAHACPEAGVHPRRPHRTSSPRAVWPRGGFPKCTAACWWDDGRAGRAHRVVGRQTVFGSGRGRGQRKPRADTHCR